MNGKHHKSIFPEIDNKHARLSKTHSLILHIESKQEPSSWVTKQKQIKPKLFTPNKKINYPTLNAFSWECWPECSRLHKENCKLFFIYTLTPKFNQMGNTLTRWFKKKTSITLKDLFSNRKNTTDCFIIAKYHFYNPTLHYLLKFNT